MRPPNVCLTRARSVGGAKHLEQGRCLLIGGRINHAIWAGVAGEESLQAHEVRMHGRPDQDGTTPTRLDQAEPAQEKRAHDPLTELGLGNQHGSQPVGGRMSVGRR